MDLKSLIDVKSRTEYDKMIDACVENLKKSNPEQFQRFQNIGNTIMDRADNDNFLKPTEMYRDKNFSCKPDNSELQQLLYNITNYGLKEEDLTDMDKQLLQLHYGNNWKEKMN